MKILVDGTYVDIVPSPAFGGYSALRKSPKITYQAEAGYKHQRNRWTADRRIYLMEWKTLTTAEKNTLDLWIDDIKSTSFYFVTPESIYPDGNGVITPQVRLVRISSEEVEIKPIAPGFFSAKITLEEV